MAVDNVFKAGEFTVKGNGDGRLTEFLWSHYQELVANPVQIGLPTPDENHTAIRGRLRRAIEGDGFTQSSRSLFKPHFGLQLVLMLARQGDYVRIYFLVHQEETIASAVGYREKHRREVEPDGI